MTSWRDSLSAEAQADMDNMLDAALPFAQQMLAKASKFSASTLSGVSPFWGDTSSCTRP